MSNHMSAEHKSKVDAAREGNGRFGSWLHGVDQTVTLSAPEAPALSFDALEDLHARSARAAAVALHNERMAGVALAARSVLADYPTAAYVVLDQDAAGPVRAEVRDSGGTAIGSYNLEESAGDVWTRTHEWLSKLEPDSADAAWKAYTPYPAGQNPEDRFTVNLSAASEWSPEAAGDQLAA